MRQLTDQGVDAEATPIYKLPMRQLTTEARHWYVHQIYKLPMRQLTDELEAEGAFDHL